MLPILKKKIGWSGVGYALMYNLAQWLHPVVQLTLAQQQEIEQLKAELKELKQR